MNKFTVIGLVAISALLGTAMQLARKYVMKSMKNYSIIFVDSFITGFTMVCAALYFGGYDTIKKDLNEINGKTLVALFGTSLAITIVSVIGYTLLRTERLSYFSYCQHRRRDCRNNCGCNYVFRRYNDN